MQGTAIQRIAGLLYDGVLSPQAWYDGMDAFKEAVGASTFTSSPWMCGMALCWKVSPAPAMTKG